MFLCGKKRRNTEGVYFKLKFIKTPSKMTAIDRDFTFTKASAIQGTGLFAKKTIPKGTRILAYAGMRVPRADLFDDVSKGLTSLRYIMHLDDTTVIDAEREGNDARFANHSCSPNCEVIRFDDIPYLYAMYEIPPDTEITWDYKLNFQSPVQITDAQQKEWFPCQCGSANCRGTLLSG
jgi:uncharacterized protein